MDFHELINHADYNAAEVREKEKVKRYSSVLPPPKKVPKANVQSEGIRRFLEKKRAEEEARQAAFQKEKEKLLALRAQNSKNNKKAKIMASRTKDNDFSKIKLTDDEIEAKKRREESLLKKNLADKVERMKARIEMEEKEKLMPKKRKRKNKNGEVVETVINHDDDLNNDYGESTAYIKDIDKSEPVKNKIHKPKPPPPPTLSFAELLKIAQKRQVEPVEIVVKKKEEEKLMTKKERKIMEEELARQRRKQERLQQQKSSLLKPTSSVPALASSKKTIPDKEDSKNPVVIHVNKDEPRTDQDVKFKIPKSSTGIPSKIPPVKNKEINLNSKHKEVNLNSKHKEMNLNNKPKEMNLNNKHKEISLNSKHKNINLNSKHKEGDINSNSNYKEVSANTNSNSLGKPPKNCAVNEQKKILKSRDESRSTPGNLEMKKKVVPKKDGMKINSVPLSASKPNPNPAPVLDEEALRAKLEKELREKIEKEIDEKIAAKLALFGANQSKANESKPVSDVPKKVEKEPAPSSNNVKKVNEKSTGIFKKDMEKMIAMRKQAMEKTILKPKMPEKKPFHKNPYLDPPRRLLEPQRPQRPLMKRRIESDDEDDDDDMSDFIDDGPSQNDEDYSKYIKEIFGYDRNRYVDDDEDDIMETSFAEQMKEETRSAKLGYLEDLEEEKLENERKKRKKVKKK